MPFVIVDRGRQKQSRIVENTYGNLSTPKRTFGSSEQITITERGDPVDHVIVRVTLFVKRWKLKSSQAGVLN
ncbi:Hypothetical protein RAK1035_0403 [Roseovarius sp. AK1035]|nr:Hypothetical protein RAK1035_0403 [Roseovarius sp. AK1035]